MSFDHLQSNGITDMDQPKHFDDPKVFDDSRVIQNVDFDNLKV